MNAVRNAYRPPSTESGAGNLGLRLTILLVTLGLTIFGGMFLAKHNAQEWAKKEERIEERARRAHMERINSAGSPQPSQTGAGFGN